MTMISILRIRWASMNRDELAERYEARGDEDDFVRAKALFEEAIEEQPSAELARRYGFLLQAHGTNSLRRALEQYERAIELEPDDEKAHWQRIGIHAHLMQPEVTVAIYEPRFAAAPHDLRERRFLARAYVNAREHGRARKLVDAGLEVAPDDWMLIELRGDILAATGDPEGALADWHRAHELEPENLSSIYSSAFLLERLGRVEEAIGAWRYIIEWSQARGNDLDVEWPSREIERLEGRATATR
jgi:tetratricopeptide (TPR) repeat protein